MYNHPDQQTIDQMKKDRNLAQATLHKKQSLEGLYSTPKIVQRNSTCEYETVEEEFTARNTIVTDQMIKQIFFCKIVGSNSFFVKRLLLKSFFEHHKFCNYIPG